MQKRKGLIEYARYWLAYYNVDKIAFPEPKETSIIRAAIITNIYRIDTPKAFP
jgi:hypothetical protein